MILKCKTVTKKLDNYDEVIELASTAFPSYAILPMPLLRFYSLQKNVHFKAYYDGDAFVGFTYTIVNKNTAYLLYFAVNEQLRSKGYGSKILSFLKRDYRDKNLVLATEFTQQSRENIAQRVSRLKFYHKNGFHETGYILKEEKDSYFILTNSDNFNPYDLFDLHIKFSFGYYCPNIRKYSSLHLREIYNGKKERN